MALCPTAAVAVLFYMLHCDANVNGPDCCGRGYCVVLHWTMCWRFLRLYNVHIIRHDDYDRVVMHSDYYCCIVCTVVVTGREPYIFRKHSSRSICASLLICSCVKPFIISFTVQCTQKKETELHHIHSNNGRCCLNWQWTVNFCEAPFAGTICLADFLLFQK